MMVNLKKLLTDAQQHHYAVPAFNVNNLEFIKAIIAAAKIERSPVIIQTTEGAIEYAGMDYLIAMAQIAATEDVRMAFHLDHGKNIETIKKAIASGYSSVMFDGSLLPFDENMKTTKMLADLAHANNVSLEAELGAIKGIEDLVDVQDRQELYTDPDLVAEFVVKTGCDALAISIGTAHGIHKFKENPNLDFDRLRQIAANTNVPLVLHGASGISADLIEKTHAFCDQLHDCSRITSASGVPDTMIAQAIKLGIRKINIDSDLRIAFTAGIRESIIRLRNEIDPRKLLSLSSKLITETARHKMQLFGSSGKI